MSHIEKEDSLTNFRRKVSHALIIAAVIIVPILLFAAGLSIIPLAFMAILIAVLLRSLADPIARRSPLAGRWAVLVVTLAIIAALGLFIYFTGPSITQQFDQLTQRIPEALTQIEERLQQYQWGSALLNRVEGAPVGPEGINVFSRLTGWVSSAFGAITNATLVIVAGIYMAFEPNLYINNFVRLFPVKHRDRAYVILDEGYHIIRMWLISRLISMIVVGILTFIGLMIIGMPLALTLAVIATLLSFIPNIGPILATVPAILVGFTQSVSMGALAIVVYFVVQLIENYLITPNVQRETVQLPPSIVMLTQIFLALLFGWIGLLIAAPLVAFGIVLVKSAYVEDILGDEVGRVVET